MGESRWTAADAPGQAGRVAVVTGANSGLGFVAARWLAQKGARVILACRDKERGEDAADRVRAEVAGADVRLGLLDLADLSSVREFAETFPGDGVDLLINNAGVMATPYRRTADGFEMQFGTNHLGHFALTGLLMPRLLATDAPRVVTVSSSLHRLGKMDFSDLQGERRYQKWPAYGRSKLANLLFTAELQRRADAAGATLVSAAAHPGYASTNLQGTSARLSGSWLNEQVMRLGNAVFAQSEEQGAWPVLYAATAPGVSGDAYAGPGTLFETRGHPRLVGRSPAAQDTDVARRLWEESERLTGVTYTFTPTRTERPEEP
ncbi:MAG: SDR family NAD(P)-dependent oxidoreductase [Streptosporangiales bacterium]|nr:SDR family NAD(P)-dependent oxidoreductase [Streptosporangiales bacterium]